VAEPARPEKDKAALRRTLLAWYDRNRRELPWRRTQDPYRIWVSEVMLQQTTVKTVLPYYDAFLKRFPTVVALAEEPEDEVLAAWSGLGYYHRARNLHRGAQHLAERHAGRFPRTLETALGVPGVGLYTASAVLSIAYGLPLPVVDGNVRRVLARLGALRGAKWRKDGPFYNRAQELLAAGSPGDWNQAVMELGGTAVLLDIDQGRTDSVAVAQDRAQVLPTHRIRRVEHGAEDRRGGVGAPERVQQAGARHRRARVARHHRIETRRGSGGVGELSPVDLGV